ncbi:magnesium transporter MgtE N-terminal domain-containing protein, partial [Pediococcus pentosaceus]
MADIFQALELQEQKELILELDQHYTSEMINHLYTDDAADLLSQLDESAAHALLKAMDLEDANDVKELMAYPPKTAGAIMTKEFISLASSHSAQQVIEQLREEAPNAET